MCLDFESDQNHEPNLKDNQDGMSNLELSSPDFPHEIGVVYPKSVLMTNEFNETLDDVLREVYEL
jgi:hypothetical protein